MQSFTQLLQSELQGNDPVTGLHFKMQDAEHAPEHAAIWAVLCVHVLVPESMRVAPLGTLLLPGPGL